MDLPKELWKRVGVQAINEDVQKREIVIKALEQYLNKVDREGNE